MILVILVYGWSDGWFRLTSFDSPSIGENIDTSYDKNIYFTVTIDGINKELVGFINGIEFQRISFEDEGLRWEDFVQGSLERM